MERFRELSVTSPESDDFEERGGRSPLFIIISIICALAVTAALLFGYMFLRGRHHEQDMASQRAQTPASKPPAPPAEVMVYEDEAMLKGSNAILGGKVQNISSGTLTDLTVELELTRREGGGTEKRSLAVEPKELAPNQQGRYSLSVLSREFSTARLLHVRSGARPGDIGFRTAPGAQRPPEPTPQTTKTLIVNRPAPRGSGDEYINTPDKPATIP